MTFFQTTTLKVVDGVDYSAMKPPIVVCLLVSNRWGRSTVHENRTVELWNARGHRALLAVGRELLRRGHEVRMAVPPDLVGFVEAAGLPAVGYGLEVEPQLDGYRDFVDHVGADTSGGFRIW